jgi:hypothetical protein
MDTEHEPPTPFNAALTAKEIKDIEKVDKKAQSQAKSAFETAVKKAVYKELMVLKASNAGVLKYGFLSSMVKKYQPKYPFLTRSTLRYMIDNHKRSIEQANPIVNVEEIDVSDASTISTLTPTFDTSADVLPRMNVENDEGRVEGNIEENDESSVDGKSKNKGGRPSKKAKLELKSRQSDALLEAATQVKYEKEQCSGAGSKLPKGRIQTIISDIEKKYSLSAKTLSKETVLSRVKANNLTGFSPQHTSPVAQLEPMIVEYCIRLARMGCPLECGDVLHLANSMIKRDSEAYNNIKAYKDKRDQFFDPKHPLAHGWYKGFMERYVSEIKRGAGKIRDIKRYTWCTESVFTNMYNAVYDVMVRAGVATVSEEEKMFDSKGDVVFDMTLQYGRPTKYELIHPEMVVFVDETGANTNQVDDKRYGGHKYILPTDGSSTGTLGSTTDMHFTVLPFISGTGEPIMCAIILKSEKHVSEIPTSWKLGIDITRPLEPADTDEEMLMKNIGEGKAMHAGPTCVYNNKTIPCFVCTSPKASITSDLLAEMLKAIDSYHVFDRSDGKKPFLLLDGHHSRYETPFLDYIHNAEHPWSCCIGVPYGTHIWQVADSPQLNGLFKNSLAKAKKIFFDIKVERNIQRFETTDIIPLVTYAWDRSFALVHNAKKAIAQRGWNPMNYYLLDHKDVRCDEIANSTTSVTSEHEMSNASVYNQYNLDQGLAGRYLDMFMSHSNKSAARNETTQAKILKAKQDKTVGESLKRVARFSSAALASENHYEIYEEIGTLLSEKNTLVNENEAAKKAKKNHKHNVALQQYMNARAKDRNGEVLTSADLKILVRHHWSTGDPKVPTKVAELRQRWNEIKDQFVLFEAQQPHGKTPGQANGSNEASENTAVEI